jgi:hypothetical protein
VTVALHPPSSKIMPKNDEDMGGISKKIPADTSCGHCALAWHKDLKNNWYLHHKNI